MHERITRRDLQFILHTLDPGGINLESSINHLQARPAQLETMLDDERLFKKLIQDKEIFLRVSPWLFFTILLRRTRQELERKAFTVEQRDRQKVVLFDADQVAQLLEQEPVRDYLATMLASFTRVESVTTFVEVRRGVWRTYRTHEFDIEGMIRYSQNLEEAFRFATYQRIGDVCLFLAGVFPEHIRGQGRYPVSGEIRPRMRGRLLQKMEDYESYGRAFYRLAAEHDGARRAGVEPVLRTLSEDFILAEKPLTFLSNRYLGFIRSEMFRF